MRHLKNSNKMKFQYMLIALQFLIAALLILVTIITVKYLYKKHIKKPKNHALVMVNGKVIEIDVDSNDFHQLGKHQLKIHRALPYFFEKDKKNNIILPIVIFHSSEKKAIKTYKQLLPTFKKHITNNE